MHTRQLEGEPRREWITDEYFDLYVWYQTNGEFFGFQLCYSKHKGERALTWLHTTGFRHHWVDSGESSRTMGFSPVLTQACTFLYEPVRTEFLKRSEEIEPRVREFILSKLEAFAAAQNA